MALYEHQQDNEQMLAWALTVIYNEFLLPVPWDQTSQDIEFAASSLILCRNRHDTCKGADKTIVKFHALLHVQWMQSGCLHSRLPWQLSLLKTAGALILCSTGPGLHNNAEHNGMKEQQNLTSKFAFAFADWCYPELLHLHANGLGE